MIKNISTKAQLTWVLAFFLGGLPELSAQRSVALDNAVAGDGRWEVVLEAGGETRNASFDPKGSVGLNNVMFDYFNYINGTRLGLTRITQPIALAADGKARSAGIYGQINWTSESYINPRSPILVTKFHFSSTAPFGSVIFSQYMDEDVTSPSDDQLVVVGDSAAGRLKLLTVDAALNYGVSQYANYNFATGMTFLGWSASYYDQMRSRISSNVLTYSHAGNVWGNPIPLAISDPRYGTMPVYGRGDIVTALGFQLDPLATEATLTIMLGGFD